MRRNQREINHEKLLTLGSKLRVWRGGGWGNRVNYVMGIKEGIATEE